LIDGHRHLWHFVKMLPRKIDSSCGLAYASHPTAITKHRRSAGQPASPRVSRYGEAAQRGEIERVAAAQRGTRNRTLVLRFAAKDPPGCRAEHRWWRAHAVRATLTVIELSTEL
jgi:hypothetical protein